MGGTSNNSRSARTETKAAAAAASTTWQVADAANTDLHGTKKLLQSTQRAIKTNGHQVGQVVHDSTLLTRLAGTTQQEVGNKVAGGTHA
jgi:hypothetical protein